MANILPTPKRVAILRSLVEGNSIRATSRMVGCSKNTVTRYSLARVLSVEKKYIQGTPDTSKVSTSIVERQNLNMRMSMRRFTRLTNAFSKKIENLFYSVALHFMAYNFIKPHGTLTRVAEGTPTTPAMAAGVTDRPMTYEQIVELLG